MRSEERESQLRADMSARLSDAVKCKRLAVFEAMLHECEFPDAGVLDELKDGADLVGSVPRTGMLPTKFKPALLTLSGLASLAAKMRSVVQFSTGSSGDQEIDNAVYEQTLQEVQCGWLSGPLKWSDVDTSWPVSKRFGLKQKHKVRLIDDFTASGVNDAVTSFEAPTLRTVDVTASMLQTWFATAAKCGKPSALVARTYDLSSAYRQIGISEQSLCYSHISVFNPATRKAEAFRCNVLPFGASRAVHSFLRCARALWWIGVHSCKLLWTSFYDDFISVTPDCLKENCDKTITCIFKLTGWLFAEEGRKCMPYSPACEALGVVFDFALSSEGIAQVSNTAARVDELVAELECVAAEGKLSQKRAQRLRGRMLFADAQIFGRTGKRCMAVLGAAAVGTSSVLSEHAKYQLQMFVILLRSNAPRRIGLGSDRVFLIFTDACFEPGECNTMCGIGGVLV